MNDTTLADRKAELARQADVIAAVARAHDEELPLLGEDNGVPKAADEEARSVSTGPARTTELAKGKGG